MKKLIIDKSNVTLHKNMNRKNLSLDTKKADSLKKNIVKQLDAISKSLDQIEAILNRMAMKKSFQDEYNGFAIQCARKCVSQAQASRSLIMNIDAKYSEDQKSILIQDLDDRISFLEKKIAKMNKE